MHTLFPFSKQRFHQHHLQIIQIAIWLSIVSLAIPCQSQDSTLRTVDAFHQNVELVDWSDDGMLEFASPGETRIKIATSNVIRFGTGQRSRTGQGVLLIDGSLLVGRITQIDQQQCELNGAYFRLSIPRPLIRSILVNAPGLDGLQREWLDKALTAEGTDDLVQTIDGDWLTGTIAGDRAGLIYRAGTVDQINLSNAPRRALEWSKIRGVIFSPLLAGLMPQPTDAVTVGLKDGSRLSVLRATENLSGIWRFQLACGLEVRSRGDQFSTNQICFVGNTAAALSAASHTAVRASDALRIRQTPNFGPVRTLTSEALAPVPLAQAASGAGGVSFPVVDGWVANGFRMVADTQAVFRLPPHAQRFTAEIACDFAGTYEHSHILAVPPAIRCTVAVVDKGGKTVNAWTSQLLSLGQSIIPVDFNIAPTAVALILSVDRISPSFTAADSVWLAPLVHHHESTDR